MPISLKKIVPVSVLRLGVTQMPTWPMTWQHHYLQVKHRAVRRHQSPTSLLSDYAYSFIAHTLPIAGPGSFCSTRSAQREKRQRQSPLPGQDFSSSMAITSQEEKISGSRRVGCRPSIARRRIASSRNLRAVSVGRRRMSSRPAASGTRAMAGPAFLHAPACRMSPT